MAGLRYRIMQIPENIWNVVVARRAAALLASQADFNTAQIGAPSLGMQYKLLQ